MKRLGKSLFVCLYSILLFILTGCAITLYDNAKEYNHSVKFDHVVNYFNTEMQFMILDVASQLNDMAQSNTYQPLEFKPGISEEERNYVEQRYDIELMRANRLIDDDPAFQYIAQSLDSKQMISNIKNIPESINPLDYGLYIHMSFDSTGRCSVDNDNYSYLCSMGNIKDNLDTYYMGDLSSKIVINAPKNLDVRFMIDKDISGFQGIASFINSWEHYNGFTMVMVGIATVVLALFFLMYPISVVETVNPFKTISGWSLEVNIIGLTLLITLMITGAMPLVGSTINGYLLQLLANYGIAIKEQLLLLINFIYWNLCFIAISLAIFLLKYMFTCGLWPYLKSHTLTVKLCQRISASFKKIMAFNFGAPINLTVLKYVGVNAIIVGIMVCLGPIGLLGVIIYSILLFVVSQKKMVSVKQNYDQLIESINLIISGNYNDINELDLGIFTDSKAQLLQLSANFESAIAEKVKSQKLKTELISNVSHDLKTPLTCIKNYITLLKDDNLSIEDRHHYMDQLQLYANRLKNLIEDLFEISKVDSGNIKLNKQELDIVALLEQVYLENEDLLEPKQLTVIKKFNTDKCVLELDSDKTYRIFENLFTNIGKYALANSRVYLSVIETEEDITIEFSNISEQPMDFNPQEITERFVRGDKSRSQQGSGLGLAIARSFTEAQEGSFNISIDCDLFKVMIQFKK